MKKITICLAIGLFPLAIYSQVDVGVKAGISLSNISADMVTNDYKIISTPESKMGYHFGGFVHASLFGVFIQPELLFTSIASDYIVTDLHTLEENVSDQRIGRVDVPVIIGAKLGTLRLGVGPVASFIVSNNSELEDITGYKQNLWIPVGSGTGYMEGRSGYPV